MSQLFDMFSAVSKEEWLAKVTKDLKGKPLEGLNWMFEGEAMSPFYHADDVVQAHRPIANAQPTNAWQIGAYIKVDKTDYKAANELALVDLRRGASALYFELEETPDLNELKVLLEGIQLEWIATNFKLASNNWKRITDNFQKVITDKGQNAAEVSCRFISTGKAFDEAKDFDHYKDLQSSLPKASLLNIDLSNQVFESVTNELAEHIAQGNALLVALNDAGVDLNESYQSVSFSLAVNDNYFESLAKVRALKALWAVVLQNWNAEWNTTCHVQIQASILDQVENDNTNKIKATTQGMSAVMAGTESLFIRPSDGGNGTSFSRRIALNVQHLMEQESYLDRVVDPAAGSYFIEELTKLMCEQAWASFQEKC